MTRPYIRPAYAPPYAAPEPPRSVLSADCVCATCHYWTRDPRSAWGHCHEAVLRGHLTHQWHGCAHHVVRDEEVAS